jgi:CBS domain-containing protein
MAGTVESIMTKNPSAVSPDTSLVRAANILFSRHFNGLPVVDNQGILRGIFTDHDLLVKGSSIHLPTFLTLLEGLPVYKAQMEPLSMDIKKILAMEVKDVMNPDPLTLPPEATIEQALQAFSEHHRVNPIPVIDSEKRLVGILSRYDIIKFFGAPSVVPSDQTSERVMDENVNRFLSDFETRFLFVSRWQTQYWFFWSLFFVVLGFTIALIVLQAPLIVRFL